MTLKLRSTENSHGARALVLKLYKNRGETPLECLKRFKRDNPEYKEDKMTYAGRLDPLAEGLLLVLVGDECKNKEKYLDLDKEYKVDILFGFSTDTYDLLGKVTKAKPSLESEGFAFISAILKTFVGKFSQKYPAFSSKTIKGKTLFSLFKSGELNNEEIPEKEVEIKSIELLDEKTIFKEEFKKYIKESIALVKGDFRQKEILTLWNRVLSRTPLDEYKIISLRVNCTSGTYMRSLANSIGEKMGVPALALNIKRIKLGKFIIKNRF